MKAIRNIESAMIRFHATNAAMAAVAGRVWSTLVDRPGSVLVRSTDNGNYYRITVMVEPVDGRRIKHEDRDELRGR